MALTQVIEPQELSENGVPILRVKTETDDFELVGRPCELSAHAYVPTAYKPPVPLERTYYNTGERKEHYGHSTYDRLFKQQGEDYYNNKLHRDDRAHARAHGLHVHEEEYPKLTPSLSSTTYGHRLEKGELDPPTREHVRIGLVKENFYRRNGTNLRETRSLKDM